ncbi:MAG TPA: hypothetical protein VIC05_09460 [Solirubrobacteraceae bacterium]|jgi:hypothetical protein
MSRILCPLALEDFEAWRVRLTGLLLFSCAALVAYWVIWLADRSLIASEGTPQYFAFEQSFPLADGWLATAALLAATQLWRRRQSAVVWLGVVGGAGMYLCAMDVLYDLQHGIYAKPNGAATELAINIATAALSIGVIAFARRFRQRLAQSTGASRPHPGRSG